MPPLLAVAASLPPSDDEETEVHVALPGKPDVRCTHEPPELVHV